jgi:hypothetical protein
MKKLIRAAWTGRAINEDHLTRALLQYRNMPSRKDGLSPAQKLFGCPVQDTLPAHRRAFAAEWQRSQEETERQAIATKNATEKSYNQHTRPLPDITIGSHVAIQNQETKHWDTYGVVVDISKYRQYFVKTIGTAASWSATGASLEDGCQHQSQPFPARKQTKCSNISHPPPDDPPGLKDQLDA